MKTYVIHIVGHDTNEAYLNKIEAAERIYQMFEEGYSHCRTVESSTAVYITMKEGVQI